MRALREAVVVVDLEGRPLQFNAAAEALLGLGGATATPWLEPSRVETATHGSDRPPAPFSWLALHGEVIDEQDVLVKVGEGSLPLVATANPLRDTAGRLLGSTIVFRGSSQEERADRTLQSTVRLYQLLARHLPDTSILLADREHRCLLAEGPVLRNGVAEAMATFAREVLGDDEAALHEACAKALAGATHWVDREVLGRWFSVQFVPVRDEAGQVLAALAVAADVTRVHERQAEREHVLAQVAHAERFASLDTLASGMAHELNNPLAVAILNLDMLRHLLADDPAAKERRVYSALEEAYTATFRVADIVHRMQMLGNAAEGFLERLDLNEIVKMALELGEAASTKLAVTLDLGPMPLVLANRGRLLEAIRELLRNAFQAVEGLPPDERRIVVKTRLASTTFVELDVTDNGCGVPESLRDHIFDPYFTTRAVGKGTGLGLALVRSVVGERGGSVELLPLQEAGGTTMRIRLPVQRR